MFKNFIRVLVRFATASTLNIISLAIAFTVFLVIALQIITEYSHDRSYPDFDRIYRVETIGLADSDMWNTYLSRPVVDMIANVSPDVEQSSFCRFPSSVFGPVYWSIEGRDNRDDIIEIGQRPITLEFAEMFDVKIIEGVGLGNDMDKVIIPQSISELYFRSESPIGATLKRTGSSLMLTVVGVYEDLPKTSMFGNHILTNLGEDGVGKMGIRNYSQFIKIRAGADVEALTAKINSEVVRMEKASGREDAYMYKCRLTPISECYMLQDMDVNAPLERGDPMKMRLFMAIALLILVIASINYINFAMALVPMRVRGLNARKIFGASINSVRLQLIGEAVGISVIAYVVAALVVFLFGTLDKLSFVNTSVTMSESVAQVAMIGLFSVLLGVVAGLYPAVYSTSFKTAYILKGSFALSPRGRVLRYALVGFQFVVSIVLIIAALFMNLQYSMVRNFNLGIEKEGILELRANGKLGTSLNEFQNRLTTLSGVNDVTFTVGDFVSDYTPYWEIPAGGDSVKHFYNMHVRSNMIDLFGIKILEGRGFTKDDDLKLSCSGVIFNRTAQKKYGFRVGDTIPYPKSMGGRVFYKPNETKIEVIGIMEDFNFRSLYEDISPYALMSYGDAKVNGGTLYIKTQTDNYPELIDNIVTMAREFDDSWVRDVRFVDEKLQQLYSEDERSVSLVGWFSLLTIMISLAGVFGLVHIEIGYRRSEIGLRKINGATVGVILVMFNRKFFIITSVCYVVALPIAIYGVNDWLSSFAYRTPLYWWVFVIAMVVVLLLTVVTVTLQCYRAAAENPVNSLKAE